MCIGFLGLLLTNNTGWTVYTTEMHFLTVLGLEVQIKVRTGLISSQNSLLGLHVATFSLCLHCLCVCSNFLFLRTPNLVDWSPPERPHFSLITSLKKLSPKILHVDTSPCCFIWFLNVYYLHTLKKMKSWEDWNQTLCFF